ncbi:MAG: peptide-methionine (S)-S-oxide reductase MsrA [Methanoregula sp.]|jgi:peptide-methionine (S)-S-oxide reductase
MAERTAVFGGGCFWGVEEAFRTARGVIKTEAGYMGGTLMNPRYEEVCSGTTGHAEVVKVWYDPDIIGYGELLDIFWSAHDPTQRDRQGPDVGTNYRSVIFYADDEQEMLARKFMEHLDKSGKFGGRPMVTGIVPAQEFYRAEEYHQQYFHKHGGGCHIC